MNRWHIVKLLVVCSSMIAPGAASAGDREPVFFGEQAALSGGAISAMTVEAEAGWYNPAGLAAVRRSRVSLSGGNLVVRLRDRPGLLEAELAGGELLTAGGEHTYIAFLPVGLGFARALTDTLSFALVGFLRDRNQLELHGELDADPREVEGVAPDLSATRLGLLSQRRRIDAGLALGWQVTPALRLGFGFFASLETVSTEVTLFHEPAEASGVSEGLHVDLEHDFIGVQGFAIFGAQWQIADHWRLGVVWRTHEVSLWSRDTVSSGEDFDRMSPLFGEAARSRMARGGRRPFETVAPPILRIGLAYEGSRGWIDLELELSPPHHDPARGFHTEGVWNLRLGGVVRATELITVGAGIFTERSGRTRPTGLLDPAIDTYGLTGGVQLRTEHNVSGREDPLVFSTTITFRYGLSLGTAAGLRYDPAAPASSYERGSDSEVVDHDLTFFGGTGVLF